MKNLLLILALSGILIQNFTRVIIYVNFEINRDYIAKNLCVNRDKPITVCGGKCYLHKEFEAQARKEQSNPQNVKSDRDILLFLQHSLVFLFFNRLPVKQSFAPYLIQGLVSASFSIFHPPSE